MHQSYSVKLYYVMALPYILPTTTMIGLYSGVREVDHLEEMRLKPKPNEFLKIIFGNHNVNSENYFGNLFSDITAEIQKYI